MRSNTSRLTKDLSFLKFSKPSDIGPYGSVEAVSVEANLIYSKLHLMFDLIIFEITILSDPID